MSTFQVRVERITIEPHDNADALEIARIGAYRSVVRKHQFQSGALVAYIPEQAVLPEALLVELGLEGRLAGARRNRVKAIRLRGVLSQGICCPARPSWVEGQDVTEQLGIHKYEPVVPTAMSGVAYAAGRDRCIRYDIENLERYPDTFALGEAVVFSEKIHGTWTQLGLMPAALAHPTHGPLVVASKGLAGKGLAFEPQRPDQPLNLYLRVAEQLDIETRIRSAFTAELAAGTPIFVLGETYGQGVQDLAYGARTRKQPQIGFRVFDLYLGLPGQGHYLDDAALDAALTRLGLSRVPVLYRGAYSPERVETYTSGRESVSGRALHLREGIVIRPRIERRSDVLGRVQLKSVSARYLLRKGGTEFS